MQLVLQVKLGRVKQAPPHTCSQTAATNSPIFSNLVDHPPAHASAGTPRQRSALCDRQKCKVATRQRSCEGSQRLIRQLRHTIESTRLGWCEAVNKVALASKAEFRNEMDMHSTQPAPQTCRSRTAHSTNLILAHVQQTRVASRERRRAMIILILYPRELQRRRHDGCQTRPSLVLAGRSWIP
jgi:hypothetical protein